MRYTIFDIPVLNTLLQGLAIVILKIFRWRIEGRPPEIPKYVMTAAPHTSNWDFPIGLAIMFAFKMNLKWLGKDALFRWPLGYLFKFLGGIPIDRSKSGDVVAQSIQAFNNKEKMILAIAPEGTRKKVHHWKTGFYYIARGADVPIVMGFLDYAKKVGGIGPTFLPTGDIEVDMKVIRGFYDGISGKLLK
jgi:1-acyl-sn-glycerol-3-phosphate acyltransferase